MGASRSDSDPGREPDNPREALRSLVASARSLLQELVEEDVTSFERREPPLAEGQDGSARGLRPATAPTGPPARPSAAAEPSLFDTSPNDRPTRSAAAAQEPPGVAEAVPWEGGRPSLEEVRRHLGECTRCGLCEGRRTIVFGDGNPKARLLFIGEGPGEQEDRRGLPFVGRAGELLTQMIEKGIGIPRSEVYICNIVKCRPPRNRTPLPPEVSACRPFLDGQIRAIAPRVIVTLGKPATSLLLDREIAITRVRGTWQEYQGIPLMPTLHPAYVLRQYTPENRRAVWEDLKAAYERSQS